jgi:fermentation-respiration switch protein FrsA (DUF1100 family)
VVKDTDSSPLEEVDSSPRDGSVGQASFASRPAAAGPPAIAPPKDSPTLRLLRLIVPPLAVIGGLGALELFRRRFERGRLFLPSRYPDGSWDPTSEGVAHEDVFFPSSDHTRLHGWFFEHPAARTTLIYCHGNRGSIADRIGIFRQLLRTKVNVFAFDYRGYGRSTGAPTERGLFADVRAAIDLMTERGHGLECLVLFGHSLGGAVAIDGAWHRPVGGLVVQASFTQLKDMARHRYPDLPMHWITSNNFRSIEKVRQLRLPKLFIHGTADEVVPYAHGEILYEAAAAPKSFLSVPDAGHHDIPDVGGRRYFQRLSRFFRRLERYRQAEE